MRMMTVHKAKGLEFPIVILADLTCRLSRPDAGRWIDPEGNVCALKLGGWAPIDLLLHGSEEAERDRAEGQRLAYVAATRARDLLVVPVVGDEIYEGGWLDPLMPAVYPSPFAREARAAGAGCPAFPSKDSVLNRPDGDPARPMTVAPGSYLFGGAGPRTSYSVVWWDPHILRLEADAGYGLRRDDLISKDGDPAAVAARLAAHHEWRDKRDAATARARVPSLRVRTATSVAADQDTRRYEWNRRSRRSKSRSLTSLERASARLARASDRLCTRRSPPSRSTPPMASSPSLRRRKAVSCRRRHAIRTRLRKSTAAVEVVSAVLKAPLFDQVRLAERDGRCDRELPITWKAPDGTLIEGTIDLAFEDLTGVTVIDFKTDRELSTDLDRYRRQLTVYCEALATTRNVATRGILARV